MNYASSFWVQVVISVLLCAFCAGMIVKENTADVRAIYLPILSATCSRFLPVFKTPDKRKENEIELNNISSRSSDLTIQVPRSPQSQDRIV